MATQKGVQDYLEKHKISLLFEKLMSRLVDSLPNEPVPYLIGVLQKVEEKSKRQQHPSKPRTPATKTKPPATPSEPKRSRPTVVRTISSGTSEWVASANLPVMGEDRGYERPWVQNMKKISRSPDSSVEDLPRVRKPKRPEHKPAPETEKPAPRGERSEKPAAKLTANSELWAVAGEESASRMPAPSDQPRPTSQQQEETLMKEELSTKSLGRKVSGEERREEADAQLEQKRSRPGQKAKEHKKELASLVASQREVDTLSFLDTGEEESVEAPVEEATDVLEDADELMDEGLSNVKSSGQKVKKKKSSGAEVKVTICSSCARVVKGDGSSEVKRSHAAFSSSSVTSSFISTSQHGMSDDDFESASQVTGPRQPVWESEGEDSGTQRSVHDGTSDLFQMGASGQVRQAWTETSVKTQRQVAGQPESLAWQTQQFDDDDSTI